MIFIAFVELLTLCFCILFFIEKRETMHATKEVKVASIVLMNAMTSISMDGVVLFRDSFKDLNTKCNTVGLFE